MANLVMGVNDLKTTHPHLVDEWDIDGNGILKPSMLRASSSYKAYWICVKSGHKYQQFVYKLIDTYECPGCLRELGKFTALFKRAKELSVYFMGALFWISLSLFGISILKISYLIPQLFSETTIIRYATSNPEYEFGLDEGLQYKNAIQWEILKSIPNLNIVIYGILHFLVFCVVIFVFRLIYKISDLKLESLSIIDLRSDFIFKTTVKFLSFCIAVAGVLVTVFSIWGSR